MKVNLEVTDTFGGEANYSWVNRETHEFKDPPSRLGIVRLAKKFMGVTGERCEVEDYGDDMTIRPVGHHAPCIICFVRFES